MLLQTLVQAVDKTLWFLGQAVFSPLLLTLHVEADVDKVVTVGPLSIMQPLPICITITEVIPLIRVGAMGAGRWVGEEAI